jgi:type II secretory ATPase GspE/PulE/Tfp pilus assembly ATPase PilB-like protein
VYELLVANESVRDAIVPGAAAGELRRLALQSGMVPLTQNAIEQARQRHTSLAEVYRISMETF